ncbi:dual specificity tyrosine-phosphorylation-regulated kinase 1A [Glossina fuscipes]|uniref:Dual specificity tyrosine-phosphorylation-regulated kinase 1A n=1 Tax=Glossina fuscipes TaxID=7396 RepID=A0A9C5Z3W6_9MUSC|nr:dual specificity tyrosine-phosphorylation-regulated kinase 1A [Glossina fuscipes]XP_037887323.1 dual specificity tyrosine-phosphorylation-regulated kinase 1A [Glossina fuscipes]KAI9582802.1 hypothetical protein GQX74_012019 [Glossina fuscipes]
MQVESSYTKYTGRVPPLDLSQVNSNNCRNQTDLHDLWATTAATTKTDLLNSPAQLKRAMLHHPYYQQHHLHNHHNHHHHHHHHNGQQQQQRVLKTVVTNSALHCSENFQSQLNEFSCDDLPMDPRDWSRADVWKWLISMAVSEGLEVTPELPQKFPMNGKALCLMSLDMYLSRVPVGGKMLYRDFRVRLARAMASLS